ncbi:MAG: GT4 family glycosyltransferase PelF [Betaproteobacteria bacterium]|nr:GT4 family glycosyltransferase PelF [Betaproteobacteria bacterium]
MPDTPSSPEACDVTLLLEGTYPYIKGGVSTWVHQLIGALPQWRFGAVFVGSRQQDYGGLQYQLPSNLVSLQTFYLFDELTPPRIKPPRLPDDTATRYAALHESLRAGRSEPLDFRDQLEPGQPLSEEAFLYGEPAWRFITEAYGANATDPSFVDYFWTIRNMHRPIWTLARAARTLPPSRLFFSPSTGYAGMLGGLGAQRQGRPFMLMEHGIYTKERRIDLMNAAWVSDSRNPLERDPTEVSHLRELWIHFFEILGHQAYRRASTIISLFEAARQQQIRDGAEPARTCIVPNGVNIGQLARLRRPAGTPPPPVICLLGRVVPVKDIKTFIRAAHALQQRLPAAQAWIVGPEDEDPAYSRECHELTHALGLGETVRFFGFRRIDEILPQVGVLVLTSISEGQPLSVLEGFAAGLPCVTTDTGACSELVYGRGADDKALGSAGTVVGLADHEAIARACAALLDDPEAYARAAQTAVWRAERYYDVRQMIGALDRLFRTHTHPEGAR